MKGKSAGIPHQRIGVAPNFPGHACVLQVDAKCPTDVQTTYFNIDWAGIT